MGFLDIKDKTFLIAGVANKKSVAYHIADLLKKEGARLIYLVKDEEIGKSNQKFFSDAKVYICNVEKQEEIDSLAKQIEEDGCKLDGLVHSIAFANYSNGFKPFHETPRKDFLQAIDISCFSFVALANALKDCFNPDASIVTISISTTTMTAENYGYMAPIKAALDSTICFLAKSFSNFSRIRFNAVCPGLLKTSASAGIPGYIDSYLFAEKAILRKSAIKTAEVANTVGFLLSPRSSGINGQRIIVDAGMGLNYFDKDIVSKVVRS